MIATKHDIVSDTAPDAQATIRRRLDEIWDAARLRDFDRLESYHLYGPRFTAFKDGQPRGDAANCAASERATFGMIESPEVDMRQLAIQVFGEVAVVTFDGHFMGRIHGAPIELDQQSTMVFVHVDDDWRIVHEHMSPLGGAARARP